MSGAPRRRNFQRARTPLETAFKVNVTTSFFLIIHGRLRAYGYLVNYLSLGLFSNKLPAPPDSSYPIRAKLEFGAGHAE